MSPRIRVMLTTEGTYPFHRGGVSTWCDVLVKRVPSVEFVVYSVLMNPFVRQKFEIPAGHRLIKVPLWGTEEPSEHLVDVPFSQIYLAKLRTDERVVREHFLPLFRTAVGEILAPDKDTRAFGHALHQMYRYFREYDYHKTFKSTVVWDAFKDMIISRARGREQDGGIEMPNVFDLTQSLGWLYRFFIVLNTPLPEVDVSHSAAAAVCGIPCVLAKIEDGVPFLLTEHGVYLREQYLSLARQSMSSYGRRFLLDFVMTICRLSYDFADQVSPVCAYNTRWEREMGVPEAKIEVIHNGVDPAVFAVDSADPAPRTNPTVVSVARVDPVKDIETLIRAAIIVRQRVPNVRFVVYGAITNRAYYEKCLNLRHSLGLDQTVIFAGHTEDVASAYRSGDVVALSSISEGFPFSVVEAMMSGRAVVATDVGGVSEALEGCGVLVRPRRPGEMAAAISRLLEDARLRAALGEEARNRALSHFSISSAIDRYRQSYVQLHERRSAAGSAKVVDLRETQAVIAERGYALAKVGRWREAIEQFRLAIEANVRGSAVPVLLTEIARAYHELGMPVHATAELERAEAMARVLQGGSAA